MTLLSVWLFAFIGVRRRRMHTEARRDVQLALLNKFQSGEEITKFLATEEGKRLLGQLAGPESNPRHKAVGLVVGGSVLATIGVAFLILSAAYGERDFLVAGSVISATGLGLFIGAAAASRLARNLDDNRKDD
ncbi:MAG: hypothetical protein H6509_10205 [Bryobacterales bacterium]|nr:hypothetical protein [Bryobacterales bacterium]